MEKDKEYEAAITWLFNQFPSYQQQGALAYKPDLGNIKALLLALNAPQKQLPFIHIAGTNGKGSCSSLLASILTAHGERVGLFTSPHLFDFRERIRINGITISESYVISFCNTIQKLDLTISPSFFEITFAMALRYFAEQHCSICVIETGLGGRLDATNIITPLVCLITNIGLDHTQFLGDNLEAIASEKAGIIKEEIPVVISETQQETERVFRAKASTLHAPIVFADQVKHMTDIFTIPLLGAHQQRNFNAVNAVLEILHQKQRIQLNSERVQLGLDQLLENTGFRGRLQRLKTKPTVFADVSHNVPGIKETLQTIRTLQTGKTHIIFGASNDKNSTEILRLFPKDTEIYFCVFSNPRSLTHSDFTQLNKLLEKKYRIFSDINNALTILQQAVNENDTILILGSFFLIADLKKDFFEKPLDI